MNKFGSKVQESRAGLPKRILVKQKIMDSLQSGIRKLKKYGNSE